MLDKLLNTNKDDSLILCYYGEILCNMEQYSKAILYFTKANIIDPENTHNLNRRAIAYYTLQDYNKVLLDLDKYEDSELEHYEHLLKYEDVLKLEGLGWIEYKIPIYVTEYYYYYIQPSIEINGSINMQIDYVRRGYNNEEITYIPNVCIDDLLPNFYKFCPNVPETFKDKYFPRKDMENLLELKDIIDYL
ncbi:hypothetical protein RhiirC2_858209 [Rhizophagus irregularis]|uniref:Uncharacterized protein n=1 Tax=Rhizophagus irregularis TaxID=588596 RepID=A0A2N1M767_9GLOM|nr:hypothetical protein RhiirC2_858209 [Rhizophagus irregularis]